jgi:hypothetical protein
MSKSNPVSGIKALFPTPIYVDKGVYVYPLSLGHYALLEKINSYLVNGDHLPDSIEVIKTLYICTHSAKEVLNDFDSLEERAFDWAETLPPYINGKIVSAIKEQIDAMMKVIPAIGDDSKKKVAGTAS